MKPKGKLILVCSIYAIGFVLLFAAILPYQSGRNGATTQDVATHPDNSSSIRFSERAVRLEPVNSGEVSSGFILVENTGSNMITGIVIRVGCGCTDVKLSDTHINPGDSIRIDFSIDTKGKYEDFVDNFLFTYSENEQNLYDVFQVTVPIRAPGKLIAEPSSLQFNRAKVGEHFSRVVELRVKDLTKNESVDIIDISSPAWLTVNLVQKGAFWELTLAGDFPNQSGRYVEFVQIKSNSQQYSEMVIPIIVEYAKDADTHR